MIILYHVHEEEEEEGIKRRRKRKQKKKNKKKKKKKKKKKVALTSFFEANTEPRRCFFKPIVLFVCLFLGCFVLLLVFIYLTLK